MQLLDDVILQLFDEKKPIDSFIQTVSGGCINNTGKFIFRNKHYFLKWNENAQNLFSKEKQGLELLSDTGCLQTPDVIGLGKSGVHDFLCMEYIAPKSSSKVYWENFGSQLAHLHRNTIDEFGLNFNNHIGRLNQSNQKHKKWTDFFISERLQPQVEMGLKKGLLTSDDAGLFDAFYKVVHSLFPNERPALLHGDLWSGNIICGKNDTPYLIDPAVYFGHREMDLAFTTLFGGFDATFYESYQETFSIEPGFEERKDGYNLYPLLVHLNLFGASYYPSIIKSVKQFI